MPDTPKHNYRTPAEEVLSILEAEQIANYVRQRQLAAELRRKERELLSMFDRNAFTRAYRMLLAALFWFLKRIDPDHAKMYRLLAGKVPDPDEAKRRPFWRPQVGAKPPGGQNSEPPKVKRGPRSLPPRKPPVRD